MAPGDPANGRPCVSVVIIFLDGGDFLAEAIASVLAQQYDDWELLLVDDGSTDRSSTVARTHAEARPDRIRYLEHPGHGNRGMSAARNLGIRHARGRYVAFLDADDVWFPQTLAEQVRVLEARPEAAMVYGPLQWWYSWSGRAEDAGRDHVEQLGVPGDTLIEPPTLVPLFLQDRAAVPSGLLVRREAIDRVGGFEEAFRGEYEDQVFCAKICLAAPVFAASRCWYRYRQHPGSSVAVGLRTGQTRHARALFLRWLARYLTEQGIEQGAVWQALRSELRQARYATVRGLLARGGRTFRRIRRRAATDWKSLLGVRRG